jgi:hypothetical protein
MKRIRRHLSYANIAATLAMVLAMSGGAVAATGGFSSGGTLKACANEEGLIRLLKPGKSCKKGQKAVTWNQTGPAGVAGAKGVAGAPGVAGANGAAGTNGQNGAAAPGTTDWAKVSQSAVILAGHGVTGVTRSEEAYFVDFDRDVTNCGLYATQNAELALSHVAYVSPVEGVNNRVEVQMAQGTGTRVAHGFSVQAICP